MATSTPGKLLIDLTDDRLKTPANREVIEFIRASNPFAHSDVGSLLFELGRNLPRAEAYCPAPGACAYVVLHTRAFRIFAIAYGMHELAFRVSDTRISEAAADRGTVCASIGPNWMAFPPWPADEMSAVSGARLARWCEEAFRHALDRD